MLKDDFRTTINGRTGGLLASSSHARLCLIRLSCSNHRTENYKVILIKSAPVSAGFEQVLSLTQTLIQTILNPGVGWHIEDLGLVVGSR
ncbi:hypothetical protein J6590_048103 [Homalodisca vitripennis]|nr:hypothetical protein J6590_048103 [Homalodisca vitripennis]